METPDGQNKVAVISNFEITPGSDEQVLGSAPTRGNRFESKRDNLTPQQPATPEISPVRHREFNIFGAANRNRSKASRSQISQDGGGISDDGNSRSRSRHRPIVTKQNNYILDDRSQLSEFNRDSFIGSKSIGGPGLGSDQALDCENTFSSPIKMPKPDDLNDGGDYQDPIGPCISLKLTQ